MHMADALLSPAVGAVMWAATAGLLAQAARQVRRRQDEAIVPLMGVLGAFVFAAQMINFAIPGTGSSGHIGGAMLLAILLGPAPAFVVIASVLTVQALFFADGGLLALGANIFNLGFFPCFVAWPLIYRPLTRGQPGPRRLALATLLATVIGLQLGALGVVLQTVASGLSSLPAGPFLALMQPIHLAIGAVEGLATAAVLLFLRRARPDLLQPAPAARGTDRPPHRPLRRPLAAFALAALLTGGLLSWFASSDPDGLEWSIAAVAGSEPEAPAHPVHDRLAQVQRAVALLPDYDFAPTAAHTPAAAAAGTPPATPAVQAAPAWPEIGAGRSLAGLLGAAITLVLLAALGWALRRLRPKPA
ncbi:MAG: energy-coupling factor ABC transporter permease [Burkholderiaceae bacterium]|nr:energy-coupling factor ABC transporter permease [Burkholderiaceae bacterium]